MSGKVSSFYGNGKISIDGYSVGTTLTWLGNDGFYVDAQGQLSLYDSDLKSSIAGDMVNGNEGWGRGLSIEAGKKFGLGGGWSITPQAQLVYSAVRFDSFQDRFAAAVALQDGDSLIGRLGLSPQYSSVQAGAGGPTRMTVYGLADLYYQFEKARWSALPTSRLPMPTNGFGAASESAGPMVGPATNMRCSESSSRERVWRNSATATTSAARSASAPSFKSRLPRRSLAASGAHSTGTLNRSDESVVISA